MIKMYICVREDVPDYIVPTLCSHAVLRHHIEYSENETYQHWLKESFRKCVVRVNDKEFNKILQLDNVISSFENKTCNAEITCLTVLADREHNVLNFAKLWQPIEKEVLVLAYPRAMSLEIDCQVIEPTQREDILNNLDLEEDELHSLIHGETVAVDCGEVTSYQLIKV